MVMPATAQNCCFGAHYHNAGIKIYFTKRWENYAQEESEKIPLTAVASVLTWLPFLR